MANIYKSEINCERCKKPILWYAIINIHTVDSIVFRESEIHPHREVESILFKDNNKTLMLKIRCKECDRMNFFSHTLPDD